MVPDARHVADLLKKYDLTLSKNDLDFQGYKNLTYDDLLGHYFGWEDPKDIRKEFLSSDATETCRVWSQTFVGTDGARIGAFYLDIIPFSGGTIVHLNARDKEFSRLSEYLTDTGRRLPDMFHELRKVCTTAATA